MEPPTFGSEEERIAHAILRLVRTRGPHKTICPAEAAKFAFQNDWKTRMSKVRDVAVTLARNSKLQIFQKYKPVNPESFTGVYRLGMVPELEHQSESSQLVHESQPACESELALLVPESQLTRQLESSRPTRGLSRPTVLSRPKRALKSRSGAAQGKNCCGPRLKKKTML